MFLALVMCHLSSDDGRFPGDFTSSDRIDGLSIRCHTKFSCGVHQFPKYHTLILKSDYTEIIFPKKRMKPRVSNGLKLK